MNKTLKRLACTFLALSLSLPAIGLAQIAQPEEQPQGPIFSPDAGAKAEPNRPLISRNVKAPAPSSHLRNVKKTPISLREDAEVTRETPLNGNNFIAAGLNPDDEVGELTVSDMPVNDVLDLFQKMTGKSILRQSTLNGAFNFHSQETLTRSQTVNAIVSLLAMNGVVVTRMGDQYLKAVVATTAVSNAPIILEGSTLNYEPSQEVCSKLFHIDFMAIPEAVTALTAMQSGLVGTSITPFEKNRSVLATDCLLNLQRMETILAKVDQPCDENQKVVFFQLRNVSAKEALTRCQQMISGPMAARFTGNTTVDADDRTNQLIAFTHKANEKLLRELIQNLDKDVDPLTRTQIFSIRHADATDLTAVIKEVITGQAQIRDNTSSSTSKVANAAKSAEKQQTRVLATQAQSIVENSGTQFSSYITIVPDERSNNLVATGTPSDIRLLSDLIAQLDAVLPQVRIEVVIAEVTLTKGQTSGLDSFGVQYGSTAPTGALSGNVTSGNGLNNGNKDIWLSPTSYKGSDNETGGLTLSPISLENFTMSAVFNVAKTNNNIQVLSAPNIVTTHNREASIIVGSREPIVSGYDTTTSTSSTTADKVATISYEDIALELTVKPLIGSNGVIQMEITQKINEVTSRITIAGYGSQPVIGTRQASSFVTVADGKMVVLGGLQKNKVEKTRNKVFLLGDIPLLGKLFQPKEDKVTRTELLIFIRPVILANPDVADADARTKISQAGPSKDINDYLKKGNFRDDPKPSKKKKSGK
jgi:general secretion pathway protein D